MKIEITPEESGLLVGLLAAHRYRVTESYIKFSSADSSKFSVELREHLEKHLSLLKHDLQLIDNLVIMLQKEVQE